MAIIFLDGEWVDPATHQVAQYRADGTVKVEPLRRCVRSVVTNVRRRRVAPGCL